MQLSRCTLWCNTGALTIFMTLSHTYYLVHAFSVVTILATNDGDDDDYDDDNDDDWS